MLLRSKKLIISWKSGVLKTFDPQHFHLSKHKKKKVFFLIEHIKIKSNFQP